MLVKMWITTLERALSHLPHPRGLQRLPDEAPHFAEAVNILSTNIRVTQRYL